MFMNGLLGYYSLLRGNALPKFYGYFKLLRVANYFTFLQNQTLIEQFTKK